MERGAYSKIGLISYQTKKINELIENRRIALAKKLALELLSDYSYDTQLLKALSRIYMIEHDYENAIKILKNVEEEEEENEETDDFEDDFDDDFDYDDDDFDDEDDEDDEDDYDDDDFDDDFDDDEEEDEKPRKKKKD